MLIEQQLNQQQQLIATAEEVYWLSRPLAEREAEAQEWLDSGLDIPPGLARTVVDFMDELTNPSERRDYHPIPLCQ